MIILSVGNEIYKHIYSWVDWYTEDGFTGRRHVWSGHI